MQYYELLGITPDATEDEIRRAYRRLSLKHHPDRGGSTDIYQKAKEAYDTLSNTQTRMVYDEKHIVRTPAIPSAAPSTAAPSTTTLSIPPATTMANAANAANDEIILEVTFDQAYNGCTLPIFTNNEVFYVNVPPGTDTNEVIRVSHYGIICVRILITDIPKNITRNGLTLTYTKEITLCEALCGFEFSIYLFGKSYTIRNNEGVIVKHGDTRVIHGLGMHRNEHKGDLIIQFYVAFPKRKLNAEQCEWLRKNLG